jgi:hypothetical protein
MSVGSFRGRRRSSRRFPEVHKAQVLRSSTLSESGLGACSVYRYNMSCFILFACDVLHITCRLFLIGGDRLHGSTLPYIVLVSCIIFMTRTAMHS